ncbi:ABC transporter substrate-binding protein [Halorubrum sp. DTA98]|uniref:ABC transporter substrate-binding protein n=1 Tax=Halorubrum sp. DTA98 TaxID=3402163 RepID=UPI003AAE94CE
MSDDVTAGRFTRRSVLRAGGVAGVAASAGCLTGTADDADGETFTIGSIQPLSGGFSPWGQAHSAGLAFAVEELNADGGVLGREVAVEEADSESNASEADTLFRRFVERENALAVTGPVSSDVGLLTRDTAEEMGVPLVLHMAGSHSILPTGTEYTFRMGSQPAATDVAPQVELIEERGYEVVSAIVGDYEWGRTLAASLESLLPDDVDLSVAVAPQNETDFTPYLRNFSAATELLMATGHPPGSIAIHNQAIEVGLDPEITTGAGLPPDVLYGGLGENATDGFLHLHASDPYGDRFHEVAGRFADDRGARFGTHEAYGYATGKLIAAAAEDAGEADPDAIAEAIHDISFETVFAEPISYTEWGELDGLVHMLSGFEPGAPDHYPDGEYRLTPTFRSSPIPGFDPDDHAFIDE